MLARALPFDQAGHIEPSRVERLQNVVACCSDKPGLRHIGFVGRRLGAFERGVEPSQLCGAFAHPPLQGCIGALKGLGRLHARRDIGEGGHQTAVGHAVGANLDNKIASRHALQERCGVGSIFSDALGDELVDTGVLTALLRDMAQDVAERDADAGQFMRQVEDFAKLPIPADQRQLLVEDGYSLADMIERGL